MPRTLRKPSRVFQNKLNVISRLALRMKFELNQSVKKYLISFYGASFSTPWGQQPPLNELL